MNGATLKFDEGHTLVLSGLLTSRTLVSLIQPVEARINSMSSDHCKVDLSGVTQVDNAGLALLIHILRLSKDKHKSVEFYQPPDQLRAIASITCVDKLLNI